jgi:hypothetical protein
MLVVFTIIHFSAPGVVTRFVATLGAGLLLCCMDPEDHLCYIPDLLYASLPSAFVCHNRLSRRPEASIDFM